MESLVKLEQVSVFYHEGQGAKEVRALIDVSIEIYQGEYVIFFGPSGCGKSTLLNTIGGLEMPTQGKVIVGDRDIAALNDENLSTYHRHHIGFVFQSYNLIPTLSVLENIALPQMFDGLSKAKWLKNGIDIATRFGIQEQIRKLPQELSGGQQQRVGIARALINNPAIILADEPIGNLDSKNARLVLDIFQDLNRVDKKTVLLVTHSTEYLSEADRIFYLKDGSIVKEERNEKRRITVKEEKEGKESGKEEEREKIQESELVKDERRLRRLETEKIAETFFGFPETRVAKRIEYIIGEYLKGELNASEMNARLDKPYEEGGAGLYKKTAERLSHFVSHILGSAEIVNRMRGRTEDQARSRSAHLRESLEAMLEFRLGDEEKDRLAEMLRGRLQNEITQSQLRVLLHASSEEGGLAFSASRASKIAYYVELVAFIASRRASLKETKT